MTPEDTELLRLIIARPGQTTQAYSQELGEKNTHLTKQSMLKMYRAGLLSRQRHSHQPYIWHATLAALAALAMQCPAPPPVIDAEHLEWMQYWQTRRWERQARVRAAEKGEKR